MSTAVIVILRAAPEDLGAKEWSIREKLKEEHLSLTGARA
jgi:hypothetical protein